MVLNDAKKLQNYDIIGPKISELASVYSLRSVRL